MMMMIMMMYSLDSVCLCVCLCVCVQTIPKSYERISMKFFGEVQRCPWRNRLDFGGDPKSNNDMPTEKIGSTIIKILRPFRDQSRSDRGTVPDGELSQWQTRRGWFNCYSSGRETAKYGERQ